MEATHFSIDGSLGEGGGQVLRTGLTLAMLYGHRLTFRNIRGNRPKPGLMRQHLACVEAARTISGARVSGAAAGSPSLDFAPGPVRHGEYHFDIGSAGSTTLVFQTILLPLLTANGPSHVKFTGGTHNPWAPSLTFLTSAFLPLIRAMGARVEIATDRWGYLPAGGGHWNATITPGVLNAIRITERGDLRHSGVTAHLSNIRRDVGEREIDSYRDAPSVLENTKYDLQFPESVCPGNLLSHELVFDNMRVCFAELGRHRLPAEAVARNLARQVNRYLDHQAVLCEHLTDQIMLPMVAAGGGAFTCGELSSHARTNRALIEQLTGYRIAREAGTGALTLGPSVPRG